MENLIVTTGAKGGSANLRLAEEVACRLSARFVARERASLASLRRSYHVDDVLVVRDGALFLSGSTGEFFFHPNMAHVRVKMLRQGKLDHFVEAAGLRAGMSVLDCTLGLGADAIVASYVVGEAGHVRALESQPLIEVIVSHGLAQPKETGPMADAMRRIEVISAAHGDFLRRQPDKSVDVVYFDPMFRRPLRQSVGLRPLRALADARPLDEAAVAEACRVARRRVVLKETQDSLEFSRLGFSSYVGGKYSRVRYGIIEVSSPCRFVNDVTPEKRGS